MVRHAERTDLEKRQLSCQALSLELLGTAETDKEKGSGGDVYCSETSHFNSFDEMKRIFEAVHFYLSSYSQFIHMVEAHYSSKFFFLQNDCYSKSFFFWLHK